MGLPKRAPLEDVLIAAQQRLSSAGAADVLRRQISGGSVHLSRDGVCSLRRSQTDAQCGAVPSSSVFSEVTPSEMFTDQVAPEWAATRPREEWDEHVARTLCTPTNVGPDVLRTRALGVLMHLILEHSSSTPFPMAVRVFSHGGTMYQIYGNARTVYGHERDQLIGGNTWHYIYPSDALRGMAAVEEWKFLGRDPEYVKKFTPLFSARFSCGGCDPLRDDPSSGDGRFHWLGMMGLEFGGGLIGAFDWSRHTVHEYVMDGMDTFMVCDAQGRIVHVDGGAHSRSDSMRCSEPIVRSPVEDETDMLLFSLHRGQNFFQMIHESDRQRCRACIEHLLQLARVGNVGGGGVGDEADAPKPTSTPRRQPPGPAAARVGGDAVACDESPPADLARGACEAWLSYWRYNVHDKTFLWNAAFAAALPDGVGFAVYERLASVRMHTCRMQLRQLMVDWTTSQTRQRLRSPPAGSAGSAETANIGPRPATGRHP
ncbi:hypothetical protein CDCA_CDCA01G0153 [Cyanidium caldarium]|uniref:Uncharacterized protein n=1 Tax=Cyanidium caldarium TaxID=2771 RepID=A0AAV9IQ33_CYACA|nr:hypothetical protein CDCA_CDCA01G0153 [Cyanidium caldarium]